MKSISCATEIGSTLFMRPQTWMLRAVEGQLSVGLVPKETAHRRLQAAEMVFKKGPEE